MRPTGHIRERTPGSWELRYSLGTNPATGKRRIATATVRGKRRDAGEKELRRFLLRTLDTGEHVDPTRMTVRQWLTTWLATVREEISPKSQERYAEVVHNFLIPTIGILLFQGSDRTICRSLSSVVNRRPSRTRRAAIALTRRYIHSVVRSALGRAVEQQLLARNPADAFKKRLPRAERREMTTLNAEQSAQLFAATKHTPIYWPVLLALSTGMRRGEILALRWKNVDLDRGTLRVVESLEQTKAGLRFKSPKTDRNRAINLPAFAIEELHKLKRQQAEELLALGIRQTGQTLSFVHV